MLACPCVCVCVWSGIVCRHVRCFNKHVVVRVGGGWDSLENYLKTISKGSDVTFDHASIADALRTGAASQSADGATPRSKHGTAVR